MGLIILMWFCGFLIGYGVSYKLNNKVLKVQNRYLKGRVSQLREIHVFLNKPIPPRRA